MSDTLFALVPVYGAWLVLLATYFSCLAVPVPSSLIMLGAGAFAASGDLSVVLSAGAALGGAVAGDQTGFLIGRWGGARLVNRLETRRKTRGTLRKARAMLHRRGTVTVFLTRWLFSPLGPYVNFVGGAMRLPWSHFTLGSVTGETVWVAIYVGLGWLFAGQVAEVSELASDLAGFLAAAAMAGLLGWMVFRKRPRER
ncbi:DedA family protein [Tropicibacter alexandrii]|uniref:DedA family protein n=1 Tax=Tropicibacter alexandrii TaxID=2267683 RepID=UPI000EF461ED|nr:DedA family protein [Tropicibacter alexandrii]